MNRLKKCLIFIITFLLIIFIKNISYSYSVGEEIELSERDLMKSDDKYCVANDKGFGDEENGGLDKKHKFQIVQYIKIDGSVSVGFNGATVNSSSNAILAAILAGPLQKGYGAYNNYRPAQQALYNFWDTWIADVGASVYGLGDFNHNTGNTGKSHGPLAAYYEQVARNYIANGTTCSVEIYFLRYCGPLGAGTLQEIIIAIPGETPPDEPPPEINDYDGYIIISGKVWVDGSAGKANDINGTYGDSTDSPLEGIKVTLRDKNGNEFVGGSSARTNSSGEYSIIVNYDSSRTVYKLYEDPETVRQKLVDGAYVEFEYDGIKYTTVSTNISGTNTSKAMENENERISFDNNHTVINPSTNTTNQMLIATTKTVINSFGNYSYITTEEQPVTTLYCNADGESITYTSTAPKGTYTKTNPNGAWLEPVIVNNQNMHNTGDNGYYTDDLTKPIYDRVIIGYDEMLEPIYGDWYFTGTYEQKYIPPTEWYWCSTGHALEGTTITNLHIMNVNLGLFEREQPDIALTSDIQQVDVTMKNQKYSYIYGEKGIESTDTLFFDTTVKFQNKYTYTYRRPVNPADIAYVNENNTEDLKVQVIYKVVFKNQSNTLPVTVRELINYYDLNYTVLECKVGDLNKGNTGQSQVANYNSTIFQDLNIVINPQASAELTIKYDVSQNAIKGLLTQNATLNNIVEIYSYSTQYGSNTLCAGQRTADSIGKVGYAYAGVDVDSQPGNAGVYFDQANNRLDASNYQDDTDIAPSFVLERDPEYKTLSGNIWEDTATDESLDNNERLGNGIKDENENIVANVKVELLKVNDDGSTELAKLYRIDNGIVSSYDAVTYTDSDGNYNIIGAVTDNYIFKFTYGDNNIDGGYGATNINGNSINARNYKSTIVVEPVKSVINGTNTSNKWHLSLNNDQIISIAVDDLEERKNIDKSLINSNFEDKHNISAYSKPFKMQVEFTENPYSDVDAGGGTFSKKLSIFNFGIIERSRENIVIDKTMSNLKITLANGQILIDGNPYTDHLDYVKALGNTITSRNVKARDKLVSIEIDTELIHGAKIDMTYAVTVTNNSEHDYDYEVGNSYYYFGEKSSLPLIKTTIEQVVDYVDDELTVTTDGENSDWTIVDWDYLLNNGYINSKLNPNGTDPDRIENKNYTILVTDAFKNVTTEPGNNSKTIYMHVSKLLGNQENEYTYENHVEIIQIGGKIARTIDSVRDDGTQVEKESVPGNYKPTDASRDHEPDDDRIIARITPPTGLLDNIGTYIIVLTISLLVIGIGTYIIKKKVLGK